MKLKRIIIISLIIILLISITHLYSKFNLEYRNRSGETCEPSPDCELQCKLYTHRCACIGNLRTAESFPPQHFCTGINFCWKYELEDCRGEGILPM